MVMFITGFLVSDSKMGIAALVCVAEGRASVKALPGRSAVLIPAAAGGICMVKSAVNFISRREI